jgi:alpha-1,3-rhamnosyl/mannosyltransferase
MSLPVPTVGFDASCTLAPRTGVGRYTLELLHALAALGPDRIRLVVLLNSARHAPGAEHRLLQHREGVALCVRRVPGPALVRGWARFGWPTFELLTGESVDVVHSPAGYLAPSRAARVATIHDLAFLRDDPSTWEPLGNALYARDWPVRLPECDAVVTDSDFVREDLLAAIPAVPRDRVHVVLPGIAPHWFEPAKPYPVGDNTPYFLAVTGTEPRKRMALLRAAYQRARSALGEAMPPLVLVGGAGDAPLPGEVAIARGILSDAMLRSVYAGAGVLVVASREEGFGFPILEAMAQGTAVLCGRNSSLPQVHGGLAIEWEPETEERLAELLAAIVRRDIAAPEPEALAAHARTFTWERAAEQMLAVYRRVAG